MTPSPDEKRNECCGEDCNGDLCECNCHNLQENNNDIARRIANVCADNLSPQKYDDLEFQINSVLKIKDSTIQSLQEEVDRMSEQLAEREKAYKELIKEYSVESGLRHDLSDKLSLAVEGIKQLPCPKCENGDGIDGHEGAGCFKQELLTKLRGGK
jgi:hypothetical protein